MTALRGRVAIVTGAGRGLGRSHALTLAKQGAAVVVNDLGVEMDGSGEDVSCADKVVTEILAMGGRAVASNHDVADWAQAGDLVQLAVLKFGDLHILVNNAGILRDRAFVNMTEEEWDAVVNVHLKGHAAPSHHALSWWRQQTKAGRTIQACITHTTSAAGLFPNFGQVNYCAAKAGIVAIAQTVALEGAKIGVRSNAVAPSARTRMLGDSMPATDNEFDELDPGHVSELVAWLARPDCTVSGQIFHIHGRRLAVFRASTPVQVSGSADGWSPERLTEVLGGGLQSPMSAYEYFDWLNSEEALLKTT
jgi:NAD(P)-dependent dehydrogenase (short-subunit alcohol dehydrogenase family)